MPQFSRSQGLSKQRCQAKLRKFVKVKNYQVVVGGIGVIYDGDSRAEAHRRFKLAIQNSKKVADRTFGKAVTLFLKGSIIKEYHPPEEDSDRTAKR
jgi:hypothetical protein